MNLDKLSIELSNFFIRHRCGRPEFFLLVIILLIGLIFFLAMSVRVAKRNQEETKHRRKKRFIFRRILIALFIIALIAATVLLVMSAIVRYDKVTTVKTIEVQSFFSRDLCSLSSSTDTQGSGTFFLGIGSYVVSTVDNYHYYYIDGGRIKQDSVSAKDTYIEYITDGSSPRLVGYQETPIRTEMYGEEVLVKYSNGNPKTYYVLYIPQGSIAESFNLH